MISDKVKAWLAAGPSGGQRIDTRGTETVAVRLNAPDTIDVFRVVEGALQSLDETIDQTIAALDHLEAKSTSTDVDQRHTGSAHAGSPLRRVLQQARLGIRAEADALKGMTQMSGESRHRLIMSSAQSAFESMPEAGMTLVASQKGVCE